jgi:predicted RNase H-like HicB family nuclease
MILVRYEAEVRSRDKKQGVCYTAVKMSESSQMKLGGYKTILYRQEDGSWVAEIPAIPGCYALMTPREDALAKLWRVFEMIAGEYSEKGVRLPADSAEIVHA